MNYTVPTQTYASFSKSVVSLLKCPTLDKDNEILFDDDSRSRPRVKHFSFPSNSHGL